jgi:hypothetical protein
MCPHCHVILQGIKCNSISCGRIYSASNEKCPYCGAKNPHYAKKGCYIATAVYGSYNCPQVWTLRRYRDTYLKQRLMGRVFISCYYKISPYLVKIFGKSAAFQKIWLSILDRFVSQLKERGYESTSYYDK